MTVRKFKFFMLDLLQLIIAKKLRMAIKNVIFIMEHQEINYKDLYELL